MMDNLRPWLSRVRVVLVSPTHPGNLGSSARAMLATGLHRLYIADQVMPHQVQAADARALASGADLVLDGAVACGFTEALAGTQISLALTARPREFEPPRRSLEQAVQELAGWLVAHPDDEVAVVFGPERSGLSNEDLMGCNRVCGLDVNPDFSSLNLSQAVQLVAFALRMAVREASETQAPPPVSTGGGRPSARPASHDQVEGLHQHLLRVAESCGALDPNAPGRMDDRLRRLWSRSGVWEDEAQMLRGVLTAIEKRLC